MRQRVVPLLLLSSALGACTPVIQGPPAVLHAHATPDPVTPEVQVTTVTLPSLPGPTPARGQWRAWLPTQTLPSGETIEGHWITLSLEAPTLTVITPEKPMPRAPKPVLTQKQPVMRRPPTQAPAPPPVPPGLPPGLGQPPGGQ
jgi:hypothetical protein